MKNTRYLLTGLIMLGLLAASVLLAKKLHPPSAVKVISTDSKSKGPRNAPVQIVEYSDFQCPACARVEPLIQKIMEEPTFAGKIHFVYRHFPLSGHRWSGLAHQAAECANEQGEFWKYHDKLYAGQDFWSKLENPVEEFVRYGKELNFKMESFGFCLANPEIHQRVMKEKNMGDHLQIRSTPTFFINGERLVGPVEVEMKGYELIRKILGIVVPEIPPAVKEGASPGGDSIAGAAPAAADALASALVSPAASSSPAIPSAVSSAAATAEVSPVTAESSAPAQ